jgi:hypothetical protein
MKNYFCFILLLGGFILGACQQQPKGFILTGNVTGFKDSTRIVQ